MPHSRQSAGAGVFQVGTAVANVWLVVDDAGGRVLIDSGHRTERALLAAGLARLGVARAGGLNLVLLTHRHCDHAGNAAWLRERFDCEVVCHVADRAVLEGAARPARLAGRGAPALYDALCRIEDAFPARTAVDGTVIDGDVVDGFEVIHVGGHTDGSVLLYHRSSATLFTGDALVTGPAVQRVLVRPRLAYRAFSDDAHRCRANTMRYLRTRPRVARICAGHGPMVTRDVDRHLARLAPS